MNEAHEILLSSLRSSGISLPAGVSSINDFSPDVLISTCSQSLRLILDSAHSFPTSIPSAAAERFNICAEVASAIKSLGYREELSFHQLLYPSNEVSYKLVRFLVERLSDDSSEEEAKNKSGNFISESDEAIISFFRVKTNFGLENSRSNDKCTSSKEETSLDLSGCDKVFITEPHKISSLQQEHVSKLKVEIKELKRQEKRLKDEMHAKTLDIQKIQDKHDIMKVSFDLAVNNQQSVELYIQELDAKVKISQQKVMELETKRNAAECSLKEKRMSLAQSCSDQLEVHKKLIQLEEIEKETEAILAEILKREAKKDATGRQAYRLLTSIHDSFQQIADAILATDRTQREVAAQEAKLAALSSHGLDIAKLQADLYSITEENEVLLKKSHNSSPISGPF
ncbi:hypothetical protein KSP39_PZI018642 [Platanthera zijinensis]|uniref:CCDC22 N-terminal domain-containing protein n=1 Tax=Platanthera zijinensis TaxID=2320716 RepID=A0AAP0B2P4_9ASPA